AGFTTGEPWLPIACDYPSVNVAAQRDDPGSLLHLYRELIRLFHQDPALIVGSYHPLGVGDEWLAYERRHKGRRLIVALNLSERPLSLDLPAGKVLLSTQFDRRGEAVESPVALREDEGLLIEASSPAPE